MNEVGLLPGSAPADPRESLATRLCQTLSYSVLCESGFLGGALPWETEDRAEV